MLRFWRTSDNEYLFSPHEHNLHIPHPLYVLWPTHYKSKNIFSNMLNDVGIEVPKRKQGGSMQVKGGDDSIKDIIISTSRWMQCIFGERKPHNWPRMLSLEHSVEKDVCLFIEHVIHLLTLSRSSGILEARPCLTGILLSIVVTAESCFTVASRCKETLQK